MFDKDEFERWMAQASARILDRHYVPARYPDAFTEGSPFEFYDEKTAQEALDCAEKICDFCITMGKKYD
jgi:HEPN domain-containing protein